MSFTCMIENDGCGAMSINRITTRTNTEETATTLRDTTVLKVNRGNPQKLNTTPEKS